MDLQVFTRFNQITGYDIGAFFSEFVLFCRNSYPILVQYYEGADIDVEETFGQLDTLLEHSKRIEPLFELKSNEMDLIDFMELLDMFTDCQTKLWTIDNSARWLRSAVLGRNGSNIVLERGLKSRENFENVVDSFGMEDPDNDWAELATKNMFEEEDYGADDGGKRLFKFNLKTAGNYAIDNIVDSLTLNSILGKDINKAFSFNRKTQDLGLVEYDAAVYQAFDTILHCIKGTIPEFPEYGFADDMYGSSVNAVSYPMIFKNMLDMFSRDGRWQGVQILDIYREDDNIMCKVSATTVANNNMVTNIQL